MSLFLLGLNYKTAALSLRERLSLGPERIDRVLYDMRQLDGVQEVCVLSTCNRTELYAVVEPAAERRLRDYWLTESRVRLDEAQTSLYQHLESDAVGHLMRVACGLDSMVLGEPQILGQLKQAVERARLQGTVQSLLGRLFERTFSVAKQVRNETDIGANGVSVAYVGVSLARQIFADLHKTRVLLIGAGETIELVGRHLHSQGVQQMTVANRTRMRAQALAEAWQAEVITLDEIPQQLPDVDIVITSTASPLPLIGKGLVERALRQRRHRPMLLIDLAVPRDVEEEVGALADAYLYSVDDLQAIIADNQDARRQAALQAEQIIRSGQTAFMSWYQALPTQEYIRRYRSRAEQGRDEELARALQLLQQGQAPEAVLGNLARRLTNKLIHHPTEALRQTAEAGDRTALAVLTQGLGLDDKP